MENVELLYKLQWNAVGDEWHLVVGNKSVARIIPNSCKWYPRIQWLSIIEDGYEDHGWHAVDFEELYIAKYDLEQWWHAMCVGESFSPKENEPPGTTLPK